MRKHLLSTGIPLLLISLLCSNLFLSCRKDGDSETPPPNNGNPSSTGRSDEDSLKYLMYNIMQVSYANGGRDLEHGLPTYYWYSEVPEIDPFSSAYATAENLLTAMISYPKNTQTGANIDRYSFLDRNGSLANKVLNGVVEKVQGTAANGDFGLEVTYAQDGNGANHLMVLYADRNSPAGQRGVQRGWEIIAINGNTNIGNDSDGSIYNAVYNSDQTTFTFKRPDNSTVTWTLQSGSYNVNPILFDSIYTVNNRPVGYFVFYTFSSVYNSSGGPSPTRQLLDQLFNRFKAAGIRDLIVDFRYNTGGAVATAQYLDSMIAPSSANGRVMYNYVYNNRITQNLNATGLPASVSFEGTGGMQLDRVFFITGHNTASASELTLNNLKPYMDVLLVGDTTYGKPVGFFSYTISDYDSTGKEKYLADLYAINFETRNAQQEGGYYAGIEPDEPATDYVNIPWGNPNDDHLRKIFNYINTGSFGREVTTELRSIYQEQLRIGLPGSIPTKQFNGMVDYGHGNYKRLR